MMTSVRKTLKMLVWTAQNRLISSEICLENNHKIGRFLPIAFWWSLLHKLPWNYHEIGRFFRKFVPKNPAKFDFFFPRPIRSPVYTFRRQRFTINYFSSFFTYSNALIRINNRRGTGYFKCYEKRVKEKNKGRFTN